MWLPLLRFNKSVCKSWRALIQTSFFVDHQTTTTTTTSSSSSSSSSSKFGSFILQTNGPSVGSYGNDIKMFMLSSSGDGPDGDGDGDGEKKKNVFKLDDLGFLPFYKDFLLEDSLRIVGSCNGIICLHDPYVRVDDRDYIRLHHSNIRDVCLWNPATKQFRILPRSIPIEEAKHGGCELVAFGFDVKTKDYKVLRITTPWDHQSKEGEYYMSRVQVYSLSTDSWRLLDGIYYLPGLPEPQGRPFRNHGIYMNGSYFFVGTPRKTPRNTTNGIRDLMMVSFDFTKEIFTTIQLPDNCSIYKLVLSYLAEKLSTSLRRIHDCTSCVLECLREKLHEKLKVLITPRIDNSRSVLSSMGDKMVVFTTPRIDSDGGYWYYDIWVLNEQQGSNNNVVVYKEDSWTKLHSFRIKTRSKQPYSEPRCISNDGEFALISTRTDGYPEEEKLQLFNLVTKEAEKDFSIGKHRDCRAVYVYKESLVSIMGGGNVLLRWQLPEHGTTYRLKWDAPFIDDYIDSDFTEPFSDDDSEFGIGLCLTSDTGGCIGVRSLKRFVKDAAEGEALAMLEAIKWAKKLELSPIIIESNSKNCVSFFMDDDDDNNSTYWSSEALSLLTEAKLLINSSELGISFQYSSRSCNYVTDIAAKLGREGLTWSCKDWTANFPGEIVMSLSKDLGSETYGWEGS